MDAIQIYLVPILRKKALPLKNINSQVKKIADCMAETMYVCKGIGLAAPQIGILSQIVVVDLGEGLRTLINHEMVKGEGESVLEEGCLSLPSIEIPVRRKDKVFIQAWDLDGEGVSLELFGFPGRVHQHEIDHLNGILIIHHISRLKRQLLIKKMLKKLKDS